MEETEKQRFIDLIEQNQGLIQKVCRLYCNSSEDRRDLFQEILLQLWRSYPSFRREASLSALSSDLSVFSEIRFSIYRGVEMLLNGEIVRVERSKRNQRAH